MEEVLVQLPSRELQPFSGIRVTPRLVEWPSDAFRLQNVDTSTTGEMEGWQRAPNNYRSPFSPVQLTCLVICSNGNNNNNNNFITGSVRLCVPRPFSIPTTPRSSPGIASPLPDKFIQRQASKQNVCNCLRSNYGYFFWWGVGESNSDKFYQETLKNVTSQKVATTCPLVLSWRHITLKIHNSDRPKQHKVGTSFFQEKLEGLHHKTGHLDVPSQCFTPAYVVTNHGVPTRKVKGFSE